MRTEIYSDEHQRLRTILKRERLAAGLRQSDIAEKTNRSQAYISKFEKGDLRLDLVDFALFCRSIGCDPHEVFDEIFEASPGNVKRTRSQAIGLAEQGGEGDNLAFEVHPLKRLPSDSVPKDH